MIERLEVAPGPGTVIRYGYVVAWAAPSASPNLVSFLAESARNLAGSALGGDQLADHLAGVLRRRDPEPHVPFVTVGPSEEGWAALLHGPVQVWDGIRWTTPSPDPGWLRTSLSPSPALSVSVSGSGVPVPSPDALWNLDAGVVPGAGFVLVPAVAAAAPLSLALTSPPAAAEATTVLTGPETGAPTEVLDLGGLAPEPGVESPAGRPETDAATVVSDGQGAGEAGGGEETEGGEETGGAAATEGGEEPAGRGQTDSGAGGNGLGGGEPLALVDLRRPEVRARVVAYPPLPPAGDPPRPVPGAPVVAGVPCPRGHLNRPGMALCARCGRAIGGDGSYQVSGTRPALGCLVADDGSVFRLDSGYLVGCDPSRDPTVRGRLARPLVLAGDDVAGSHAEIRLHDWDVVVTDRSSDGGTYVFEPGSAQWERLRAYEPRVIPPGTHLAVGQRVLTFISPWTTQDSAGRVGQDTSPRY